MPEDPNYIINLIDEAQKGDDKAIEQLLKLFQPLVRKWSAKASLHDKHNKKEIEQELNYTIIKAIRSFKKQ